MIDLHIHTNYSSGAKNLIEVLKDAEKTGVSVLSITDNNTCEAYKELKNIDIHKYFSGKIIPGCEFSTMVNNVPIELIGYNIDTDLAQEKISNLYLKKRDYNIYETNLIIEKCINMGIKLDVKNIKYDANKEKGRKAVFNEMVKYKENKKFISEEAWNSPRTFFLEYLSNPNSDLFVDFSGLVPSYKEIYELIKQCNGKVFMPHIFKYGENSSSIIRTLIENKILDGIEIFYPYYSNEQQRYAYNLAKENGLLCSGGSDSHGTPDSLIGIGRDNLNVPEKVIENWLDLDKLINPKETDYGDR